MTENKPKQREFANFGEYLYWSYANIQMLFAALSISKGIDEYDRRCYMIRSKFFKGYKEGRYNIRDLIQNNIAKLRYDNTHCWYCGCKVSTPNNLTIDHIFPRSKGGSNDIDNIFLVCKNCNSSKGDKDLIEWFTETRKEYPPLYLIVHYLKQIYFYSKENNLLELQLSDLEKMSLPFNLKYIPLQFPQPKVFVEVDEDNLYNPKS